MRYLLVKIVTNKQHANKKEKNNAAGRSLFPQAGRSVPDLWRLKDNLREMSRMRREHNANRERRCNGKTNFSKRNYV